jgi:uncharacterized membrane protein YfcA
MTILNLLLVCAGAFAAGLVNAVAGGGTLISFPILTALGMPPVVANVTNTVALCPGYLGATLVQRNLLVDQNARLWWFIPAGVLGGLGGALLLLVTGERLFSAVIPWLILLATLLMAAGEPINQWLTRHQKAKKNNNGEAFVSIPVALASVYGGYFGAGLSVIILAVLGIALRETLMRLNALKQAIALSVNIAAAVVFIFSGKTDWLVAAVMAVGALAGGGAGARLSGKINPVVFRWVVVGIGLLVSVYYFIK